MHSVISQKFFFRNAGMIVQPVMLADEGIRYLRHPHLLLSFVITSEEEIPRTCNAEGSLLPRLLISIIHKGDRPCSDGLSGICLTTLPESEKTARRQYHVSPS